MVVTQSAAELLAASNLTIDLADFLAKSMASLPNP
jgi:hypothetical protein